MYLSQINQHNTGYEQLTLSVKIILLTLEYYRGSARPGSNEVIHIKLRKRKSARFQLFNSFMFLYD